LKKWNETLLDEAPSRELTEKVFSRVRPELERKRNLHVTSKRREFFLAWLSPVLASLMVAFVGLFAANWASKRHKARGFSTDLTLADNQEQDPQIAALVWVDNEPEFFELLDVLEDYEVLETWQSES